MRNPAIHHSRDAVDRLGQLRSARLGDYTAAGSRNSAAVEILCIIFLLVMMALMLVDLAAIDGRLDQTPKDSPPKALNDYAREFNDRDDAPEHAEADC